MSRQIYPLELASERVRLREFRPGDADAVHRYASDPLVVEHLPWGPNQMADSVAHIERALAAARTEPRHSFQLAVTRAAGDEVIGGIRLGVETGPWRREASFGYVMRRDQWGQGLMTEAARLLLTFAFAELGLHRVWATCGTENAGSARVLEKLGMRREGQLKAHMWVRGVWRDSYLYAILEDEWKARP